MPNSKFTYGWNVARIAAIILAFTIFFVTKTFAVGGEGFAPNLEFSNTEDRSHLDFHREQEIKESEQNAENWCDMANGGGQDLTDQERRDATDWFINESN